MMKFWLFHIRAVFIVKIEIFLKILHLIIDHSPIREWMLILDHINWIFLYFSRTDSACELRFALAKRMNRELIEKTILNYFICDTRAESWNSTFDNHLVYAKHFELKIFARFEHNLYCYRKSFSIGREGDGQKNTQTCWDYDWKI